MNDEKAQIQIQFNWIFVIIIGSVLLIFFFTLISGQSRSTEERIDISQSRYFETIVSATGQKSGTLKEYQLKDIQAQFTCNANTQEYSYSVENLPARDTTYDIIFSPDELIGDDMFTWTQDWQVPFSAGNFLYITNSDHVYVFYETQTQDFELLLEGFPKNISYEILDNPQGIYDTPKRPIELKDIYEKNYARHTFVFLYGEEPRVDLQSSGLLSPEEDKVVIIRPTEQQLYDQGFVYYFTPEEYVRFYSQLPTDPDQRHRAYQNPSIQTSSYLARASMYGTLFSEDIDFYECTMQKAFGRLKLISELYEERTLQLIVDDGLSSQCQEALGSNDDTINFFPRGKLSQLVGITQQGFSLDTTNQTYQLLKELQENNQFILSIANCPPIY